jgi:thymidylate kinase
MIAFSGLDGAGKSTQIDLLAKKYKDEGSKSLILWARGGYTTGMKFVKNLFKISKKTSTKQSDKRTTSREKSFSNPLIRKIWLSLSILDLILLYGFYVRIKELSGVKIICDRFIYDTLLDFELNFPDEEIEKWTLWKLLLFISVKPKKHFVITIPVKESLRRSKLKNEPFPDSIEVLESRLNKYLKYVSVNKDAIHIDGTGKIDNIHFNILKELNT